MIITSLLDTDLYIFTMAQAILHQYSWCTAKFKYKCRSGNNIKDVKYMDDLNKELDSLCDLTFKEDELQFLYKLRFIKKGFIDYLKLLKLNRSHIHAYVDNKDELHIEINGPLFLVIWFEVPVLAIVQELNSRYTNKSYYDIHIECQKALFYKIEYVKSNLYEDSQFKFVDFGTRRRYNKSWHDDVVAILSKELPDNFAGTSNVFLAKKYDLTPIGTMAHLWFQLHQQVHWALKNSQKMALTSWCEEYKGDLGIALSDIGGFDWFLKDFDLGFAKLFDGCRHDSGDPYWWCEKLIGHYKELGIDPKWKTAVFSDGLTIPSAVALYHRFNAEINTSFGIGTNLTNDVGIQAQQIVIKMVECNGRPVAKISDSDGKGMCEDKEFEEHFRNIIRCNF